MSPSFHAGTKRSIDLGAGTLSKQAAVAASVSDGKPPSGRPRKRQRPGGAAAVESDTNGASATASTAATAAAANDDPFDRSFVVTDSD